MKAIRMHRQGGPELLAYEDAPKPALQPGDALVRVIATSITQVDYFRGQIHRRQAYFCMFSSRKANTSGSQMFTPRWRKSCPSSTVWPIGG